jgi:hypothetical protein
LLGGAFDGLASEAIGASSTVCPAVSMLPMVKPVLTDTVDTPAVSARAESAVGKSSAAPTAVITAAIVRVRVVVRRMIPSSLANVAAVGAGGVPRPGVSPTEKRS